MDSILEFLNRDFLGNELWRWFATPLIVIAAMFRARMFPSDKSAWNTSSQVSVSTPDTSPQPLVETNTTLDVGEGAMLIGEPRPRI